MLKTKFRDYMNEHLNEALEKGIPAVAIQKGNEVPELIKEFNDQVKSIAGRSIDMKKCKFAPSDSKTYKKARSTCRSLTATRYFFILCSDKLDNGVGYSILSKRGEDFQLLGISDDNMSDYELYEDPNAFEYLVTAGKIDGIWEFYPL